jgi:hypothetical protein
MSETVVSLALGIPKAYALSGQSDSVPVAMTMRAGELLEAMKSIRPLF